MAKKKTCIFVVFSLAFLLMLNTASAGECDSARIIYWDFEPKRVGAGDTVTINARLGVWRNMLQSCQVLVEASIVPKGMPYLLPLATVTPSKCCPGNENYDDKLIEFGFGPSAYQEIDVTLTLQAPTPYSYDHCADCAKNPERCEEGFYWNGEGYYDITLSTWNGCWKDLGDDLKKFDGSLYQIYVKNPKSPTPNPVCGNGVCEPGENIVNCFKDCSNSDIFKNIPLKLSDIIIIGIIVSLIAVALLKR